MNQGDKKPLTLLQCLKVAAKRLKVATKNLLSYEGDIITDKDQIPNWEEIENTVDNEADRKKIKEINELRVKINKLRVKSDDYKRSLESQVSASSGRKKGIKYKKAEQTDKEIGE